MTPDGAFLAQAILILGILLVVLVICWIILPFAIIGTKPLLRQLIEQQTRTNRILEAMAKGTTPPDSNSGR